MNYLCSREWFFGYRGFEESSNLLKNEPAGTYIARFSLSQPGNFSFDLVYTPGNVISLLIESSYSGFTVTEVNGNKRKFETLIEAVEFYKEMFKIPMKTAIEVNKP